MAKKKDNDINKTNAMRLLEQGNVPFRVETYEYDEEHLGGEHVAAQVSLPADQIFKTLVVRGEKQGIMVFCIPVTMELDLKKAAKTAKDKKNRNDPCQRAAWPDRLYSGRLLACGDEEKISDLV